MYIILKRLFDVFLSSMLILILLPLFLSIALILLFSAEGEIFYLQKRIGFKNTEFKIFKFATMLKNSMNMGAGSITLKDDFRVTKFGKFLRKTKLNEIPQLFNIFKGEISFVGPRPLVQSTFDSYSENIKSSIYNVKPGLTGIGSIVFRDEEQIIYDSKCDDVHLYYKNNLAPYKGKIELWYQNNFSFFIDLKIILLTAWVIFFPKSRYYEYFFKGLPKRKF